MQCLWHSLPTNDIKAKQDKVPGTRNLSQMHGINTASESIHTEGERGSTEAASPLELYTGTPFSTAFLVWQQLHQQQHHALHRDCKTALPKQNKLCDCTCISLRGSCVHCSLGWIRPFHVHVPDWQKLVVCTWPKKASVSASHACYHPRRVCWCMSCQRQQRGGSPASGF